MFLCKRRFPISFGIGYSVDQVLNYFGRKASTVFAISDGENLEGVEKNGVIASE